MTDREQTFGEHLTGFLEQARAKRERDAETFRNLDSDLCMLCDAYGADKRSLFIDCLYAVDEVVPEALNIREVGHPRGQGYYLLICKSCRGELLSHMQAWRNERVGLRASRRITTAGWRTIGTREDDWYSDGDERNIPVRVNGAVKMMTRDEWEAFRAAH